MSGMSAPLGFGFGARYMTDQTMKFTGEGTVVAVRMQTTDYEFSDVADIGFSVSVSGTALSGQAGYTDYPIIPQPIVVETPSRRGGNPETQLQLNRTTMQVSHTWVLSQMDLFSFQNPMSVFRDPRVIGVVYAGELTSVESIWPEHAGGQVISWNITVVGGEINVTG
jgi:hypothetical protein